MKIIISGGLGYVGGRLSKYLCEQGHKVIALSRQAGTLPSIAWPSNLQVAHPNALLSDLSLLKGHDVFIHLAALNENDCVKYPEKAIEVNITHTLQWLDKAHEAGIKKFIYFSTAHVYGKPLTGYLDEDTLARPVHPYAITHKCAEDYVLAYAAEKGMENMVIRLTNAFGSPAFPTADRWTLLVNDLCRSAVSARKMTLLSDGLQVRDFVCLADVCEATRYLMQVGSEEKIFNLGAGYSRSVFDMASQIKKIAEEILKQSIVLERKEPNPITNPQTLTISMSKLLKTGFQLKNNIEDEIAGTINFFRKYGVS